MENSQGPGYDLATSESINGIRNISKQPAILNFKKYEMITKRKAVSKPVSEVVSNPKIESSNTGKVTHDLDNEELFLDQASPNLWTTTGYQNNEDKEEFSQHQDVNSVIISKKDKKKEKNIFGGFEMKKRVKTETKPMKEVKMLPNQTEIKRRENDKKAKQLAQNIFAGANTRITRPVQSKVIREAELYMIRPKQMSLEDYEELWEDFDHKLEGSKEATSLITKQNLKIVISDGLKMAIVSEDGDDIIAAGEDNGSLVLLYLTFDVDDNSVEYNIAGDQDKLAQKVRKRLEGLVN